MQTNINVCDNCPLRLFNNRGHNISGIGNAWSGNALVLPNVDVPAYKKQDMSFSSQLNILHTILPTGGLDTNLYVFPLIRCNERFDIEVNQQIINRCLTYFNKDISIHQIKNIMLCGDAARRLLNIDDLKPYLDTVICERSTKRRYFVNYSPLVKYTNDENFEIFRSHLIKYYNSVVSKIYDYEIRII